MCEWGTLTAHVDEVLKEKCVGMCLRASPMLDEEPTLACRHSILLHSWKQVVRSALPLAAAEPRPQRGHPHALPSCCAVWVQMGPEAHGQES